MADDLEGIFEELERNYGLKRIDDEKDIGFDETTKVLRSENSHAEIFMLFEYMESLSDEIYNIVSTRRLKDSYLAYAEGDEELLGIVPREFYRDIGEVLLENGFTNKHFNSDEGIYLVEEPV